MEKKYIVIVGIGRSGTNWLFDLLNLSEKTHCRNATQSSVPDSPLVPLLHEIKPLKDEDLLNTQWNEAVDLMSNRVGALDGQIKVNKEHYQQWAQSIGLIRILSNYKLRETFQTLFPSLARQEWSVPFWITKPTAFKKKTTVLRIGGNVSCLEWVLKNRSNVSFLHMARHPGGFLKSWKQRYLNDNDQEIILHNNIERLRQVIQFAPEWSDLIGNITELSVEETELWFWRYSTETLWKIGQNQEQYKLLTFEKLAGDFLTTLQQVYKYCDLPFTTSIVDASPTMVSRFSGKRVSASEVANKWRDELELKDIEIIEKVLYESPLLSFWDTD